MSADNYTKDVSEAGLCFFADRSITKGTTLEVSIPVKDQLFKMKARVAYSLKDSRTGMYRTGISFRDSTSLYHAKLAEEILSIERYREKLVVKTGDRPPEGEIEKKWIKKNAKRFGKIFGE